jgi:hypothetical protein
MTWCRVGIKGKKYFSTQEWFFATVLRRENEIIGLREGRGGVCILRIGSNQSSPILI